MSDMAKNAVEQDDSTRVDSNKLNNSNKISTKNHKADPQQVLKLNNLLQLDDEEIGIETTSDIDTSKWEKYWSADQKRFYYHHAGLQKTQWEMPENYNEDEGSKMENVNEASAEKMEYKEYKCYAKMNKVTGRFNKRGGAEYWYSKGISSDKAGRQLSTFFNMSTFEKNREDAKKRKLKLQNSSVNWKKVNKEQKAKKKQKQTQWLYDE